MVENDGKVIKFFISSGSVTVNDDSSVQVLAEEAHVVEDIDINEARQVLTKYQSQLSSAGDEKVRFSVLIDKLFLHKLSCRVYVEVGMLSHSSM